MLSSLLAIFHLRNGLKAASTAYEGKKHADQWRASTARNETDFPFFKNDSVLDYPRTLRMALRF